VNRPPGSTLADRVVAGIASVCPARLRVVPTGVPGEPVLRGAMLAADAQVRAALLASVADPPVAIPYPTLATLMFKSHGNHSYGFSSLGTQTLATPHSQLR